MKHIQYDIEQIIVYLHLLYSILIQIKIIHASV
jgi:hypothetical protein